MANTIQIAVTLDESGLTSGIANVNKSIDSIPAHSKPAFQEFSKGQQEARDAAALFGRTLGVELPRQLEGFIARSSVLGPVLSGLFNVSVVAAFGAAIVQLAPAIESAAGELVGYTSKVKALNDEVIASNQKALVGFSNPDQGHAFLNQTNNAIESAEKLKQFGAESLRAGISTALLTGDLSQAAAAWYTYHDAVNKGADEESLRIKQLDQLSKVTLAESQAIRQAQAAADASGLTGVPLMLQQEKSAIKEIAALEQQKSISEVAATQLRKAEEEKTSRAIVALRQQENEKIAEDQAAANQIGLTGLNLFLAQEAAAIEKRNAGLTKQYGAKGAQAFIPKADDVIRTQFSNTITKQGKDWSQQIDDLTAQLSQAGAQGFNAIDLKVGAQQSKLIEDFNKEWGNFNLFPNPNSPQEQLFESQWIAAGKKLQDGLTAIANDGDRERAQLMRQNDDEVVDAQNKAAIAMLPPWLQANAEIIQSFNQTSRTINEQFNDQHLTKAQARALYGAALEQENADLIKNFQQTRDELASQIGSIFDDITSGNLRQAVLGELKHLFSEILAQWLLTLNGMKSAGGGQGILGSILGGIFGGNKSSSGSSLLGDFGELVPSFAESGSIASVAPIAVAGSGLFSGLQSPFSLTGGTGLTSGLTSPFAAQASSIGLGLSAGAGTASAVNLQTANSLIGSTLEQSLAKFFPHGVSVGGLKIGGPALAGLGAGVGLSSLLYGYQSGSPALGGLGGAAGGAMLGFSFGGPLGAVIGGAIGGIGGLLSGIFGRQKRHDEAETLIQGTLGPQIAAILQSYDKFSTDQQDAISQLNDLETQAKQQLDQLGQDKLYWSELVPQVNSATDQINQIQGVRDQRSALNFAPPEFATGGTVPGFGPVPIIAHGGEEIVRQPYAGMFRAELKARNMGSIRLTDYSAPRLPQIHVEMHNHISAMDSGDVQKFFDKHGRKIRQSIRADMLQNWNGGNV